MFTYNSVANTAILMFFQSVQRSLRNFTVVFLSLTLLPSNRNAVFAMDRIKPSRGDFALCQLSAEDKEKFLDKHNTHRGKVNPPAADMEYLVSHAYILC